MLLGTPHDAMNINDLPTEILLEIFLFFSAYDWVMVLPEVCSLWNSIISSYAPFWGNVRVFIDCTDFFETDNEPVVAYKAKEICVNKEGLSKVKYISNVKIIGISNSSSDLETILNAVYEDCKEISILECYNCIGDITDSFIDLLNILYPNIKSLKFILSSSSINKISYTKISKFKHLKSLATDDHCFTDSDIVSLAKGPTSLTRFAIPCSHSISDYGLVEFLISHKLHLEELHVSGYGITSQSFSMISQCLKLTTLSVFDARQLNDKELLAFSKLPRLQVLSLHRATFSTTALSDFLNISLKKKLKFYLDLKFYSMHNCRLEKEFVQVKYRFKYIT